MSRFLRQVILLCTLALAAAASGCAQSWQHLGSVQRVERLPDGVELTSGKARVRITAYRDGVIRVRLAPQGAFPKDCSWTVVLSPAPPPIQIGEQVPLPAAAQRGVLPPQLQHRLHVGKNLLLGRRAPSHGERTARILRPAPGKVAAIVRVIPSGHPDLVPVVDLRDAAHRQHQPVGQLEKRRRAARLAHKPLQIVIREKRHQLLGMRIEPVVAQNPGQLPRRFTLQQHIPQREAQRKIK